MNTVNKECDCLDARSDAFKRISGDVLIKRITEYFDEVILIECATGKVLNISDRIRTNKTTTLYAGLSYDEHLITGTKSSFFLMRRKTAEPFVKGLHTAFMMISRI